MRSEFDMNFEQPPGAFLLTEINWYWNFSMIPNSLEDVVSVPKLKVGLVKPALELGYDKVLLSIVFPM